MKQRFSKRTRLVSALLTLAMVFTFLPFSALAATTETTEEIPIDASNFPDEAFRNYLLNANHFDTYKKIDKDRNKKLSEEERNAVTKIVVYGGYKGQKIKDLTGIQYFPNLKFLLCYENQLTELDVSENKELKVLSCGTNQLSSLDVSQNPALTGLNCSENHLTSLDVSQNPALENLNCYKNHLTSLDVSKNLALGYLDASGNQIDINVEETSRTFDLSTLPGFDMNKVSGWNGGTVKGNILTVNADATRVTYDYNCGRGISRDFALNVNVVPDGTVIPPAGGGTTPGGPTGGETGGSSGGGGGGGGAIIVVAGAAAVGLVGYGIYNYVAERQLQALLPEGAASPENRAQTALLLWNTAGRPEPAAQPAFPDVADPDTAKAAQWCVEHGLMNLKFRGRFAPDGSSPAYKTLNAYRQLVG